MADLCEHENESSVSRRGWEFHGHVSDCQILKKVSAAWSYFSLLSHPTSAFPTDFLSGILYVFPMCSSELNM